MVPVAAPVALPALTHWKVHTESPEARPGFDDSSWVEPVRGFVEDQKIGIVEQCDGKAQPLLHAQRVSPHTVAIAAFQRNDLEHLVDALVRNAPQHVSDDPEVVAARQVAIEGRRLDKSADPRQDP